MTVDPRWHDIAARLDWTVGFRELFTPGDGHGRWFVGGRLDVAANCVDRHLTTRAHQPAVHWEGEPGDRLTLTFAELHRRVAGVADALRTLGVEAGTRVAVFAGLVPEAVTAVLALARLGATTAILPPALPAEALAGRLSDLGPQVLITQDGAWRHGVVLPLKARADEALTAIGSVDHTVVIRRTGIDVPWFEGDRWHHDLVAPARRGPDRDQGAASRPDEEAEGSEADAPLWVTYVANRRGAPTGVMHPAAGLLAAAVAIHTEALTTSDDAVLWAPMELGWVGLLTHGILGPLCAGDTTVLFEGMLDTPSRTRAWETIERYGVTTLIATPSVWRALRRWQPTPPPASQTTSLEVLASAGEPAEDDTLAWLAQAVGRSRTRVLDAFGQTELGGIVAVTPPVASLPDPQLDVVDADAVALAAGRVGDLVLRASWPAVACGLLHAPRDVPGLDSRRPGVFVTEDLARQGAPITVLGRRDPVFNVAGQLVSAAEVANVLSEHPFVGHAVVGDRPHRRGGRALIAAVEAHPTMGEEAALADELRAHVHATLGGLAVPDAIVFVEGLATRPGEPVWDDTVVRGALRHLTGVPADGVASRKDLAEAVARTRAERGASVEVR